MPTRYDYKCRDCGHTGELTLSMASKATPRKCPRCEAPRKYERQFTIGRHALDVAAMHFGYENRFPYVSRTFPAGGHLAGAGRYVGKNRNILVENKGHEERLRGVHGFVGEDKVTVDTRESINT